MKLPKDQLEPIMTNSENIIMFGPNAYAKPATALNILRETILGRELFDFSFREYCRRWAFKHPTPADLFRTMEDASGEDLDWFWRGWFYNTDPCDISLDSVKWAVVNPEPDTASLRGTEASTQPVNRPILNSFDDLSKIRNRADSRITYQTDTDTTLRDFYWKYARGLAKVDTTPYQIPSAPSNNMPYSDEEKKALAGNTFLYEIHCSNKGGLVMPVIIEWTFKDGTKETDRLSVHIWRKNENHFSRVFVKSKEAVSIKLDPMRETADIDEANNTWPVSEVPSRFQIFKSKNMGRQSGRNPMQREIK